METQLELDVVSVCSASIKILTALKVYKKEDSACLAQIEERIQNTVEPELLNNLVDLGYVVIDDSSGIAVIRLTPKGHTELDRRTPPEFILS
jgi:hypothetical protein